MATYDHGVHGAFHGTIGKIVGSQWKGKAVMKIRPSKTNRTATTKQLNQRTKFGIMMRFLNANRKLIRVGYNSYANKVTEVNVAMAENIKTAMIGESPDYAIDYALIQLSKGTLPGLHGGGVVSSAAHTLTISWTNNSDFMGAHPTDKLYVGVYDPETNRSQTFSTIAERQNPNVVLNITSDWSGKQLEVYTFFKVSDGTVVEDVEDRISPTKYLGSILLT